MQNSQEWFFRNFSNCFEPINQYTKAVFGCLIFVKNFEKSFARFIGKKNGLTFCNGTSSIEAAIYALDLKPNSEILIPSSTFHASIGPIINLNFVPKFVDIDKETLTIDCKDLENKINENTKALIIVHPWGYPCNMDKILEIVQKYDLKLIEDCSHAHGATYNQKKVGNFADISCFSLQGNKAIAAGEGGIALTDNDMYFFKMSIYGHFNRHQKEIDQLKTLEKFSKTGISKKLRAHPLGISIAKVDFDNLLQMNKYKQDIYEKIDHLLKNNQIIKTLKLNQNSIRGGFFGGYPLIINELNNIEKVKKIFKNNRLQLMDYPWLLHHKMPIYNTNECQLSSTENIANKLFLLNIPQFLNFKFKNFENCLKEISLEFD